MSAAVDHTHGGVLVGVDRVSKHFTSRSLLHGRRRGVVRALDDVTLPIYTGEILGLVGESGSGKTTLGRVILQLEPPTSGRVSFGGRELTTLSRRDLMPTRRKMQIVYQDPYGSLEARMRVRDIVAEGLDIHRIGTRTERTERVAELLTIVGLSPDYAKRYPHEFSGGQRQRISIARALALEPEFLVADEPVSALDVSVRAQIINLLIDLTHRLRMTMLFVSHDLSVVENIADRVAVMYLGRLMEVAPREALFNSPRHPYTKALIDSIPSPDPSRRGGFRALDGDIPSPVTPPSGCVFRTRCPLAVDACSIDVPELRTVGERHAVACWRIAQ